MSRCGGAPDIWSTMTLRTFGANCACRAAIGSDGLAEARLPSNSARTKLPRPSDELCRKCRRVWSVNRERLAGSIVLSPRQSLDRDVAAVTNMHFQFVVPQKAHPNQRDGFSCVDKDRTRSAVPHYLAFVYPKNAFRTVCKNYAV